MFLPEVPMKIVGRTGAPSATKLRPTSSSSKAEKPGSWWEEPWSTVKPHEVRGAAIKGGATVQLSPGEIVHLPAHVPHPWKVAKTFTYTVIKVDVK